MNSKHIVVTCIGDSSPNGNCLGGIASSPNCSPNPKLVYTHELTYHTPDGKTFKLIGVLNGEKRSNYHFYLPKNTEPQQYEEALLHSYPSLVAQALNGIEIGTVKDFKSFYEQTEYNSMTAAAMRSGDILNILNSDYSMSDALWKLPMAEIKREELINAVNNGAIDKADYIIFAIGSNDIFAGPVFEATVNGSNKKEKMKIFFNSVKKGVENYKKNLPLIIDSIKKRNTNCSIVFVGAYNPVFQYTLHDILMLTGRNTGRFGRLFRIGNLLNKSTDKINKEMLKVASENKNIVFVDIDGVPLFTDKIAEGKKEEVPVSHENVKSGGLNANMVSSSPLANSIHPTEEGHSFIARRILGAIKQLESGNSNLISVDVSDMGEIVFAKCNSKTVEYTVSDDGSTVFLSGNGRSTLRVKIVGNREGISTVRTWKCYKTDKGYWSRIKRKQESL